jgi:hypothetical protein
MGEIDKNVIWFIGPEFAPKIGLLPVWTNPTLKINKHRFNPA